MTTPAEVPIDAVVDALKRRIADDAVTLAVQSARISHLEAQIATATSEVHP